jgi:C4-type Zn-finger protein
MFLVYGDMEPCPFCGSTALEISMKRFYRLPEGQAFQFWINCQACGSTVTIGESKPAIYKLSDVAQTHLNLAVSKWNGRRQMP